CHFIPTNSDYADDHIYYHDDGDFTSLDNTKDLLYFIKDNYEEGYRTLINHFKEYHNLSDEKITSIVIEHYDFNAFWSFVLDELNENRYFGDKPVKKEWFIVPDTLFLTKNEAKEHLERYKGRYSAEARTYAMTALNSDVLKGLIDILHTAKFEASSVCSKDEDLARVTYAFGIVQESCEELAVLDWEEIVEYAEEILSDWHSHMDIQNIEEEGYLIPYSIIKWEELELKK